jgi:NitT/TauT family transport system permease protein/sulfonate transport system permease protein
MPGPVEVAASLWDFVTTPRLVAHMLASFAHVGVAIALSFALGFALALLPTYVPVLGLAIHRRLTPFLNAFSGVGWTLLAVMWFGVTPTTVVFSISAVLVPFALVNLSEGLASIDRETLEMATSFTRSRRRAFGAVVLPALAPFMLATLRIMFGVAWKVTLTAELFGGNSGFGYVINLARQEFDAATIFVCIILIIAFVYASDRLVFAKLQVLLGKRYGTP